MLGNGLPGLKRNNKEVDTPVKPLPHADAEPSAIRIAERINSIFAVDPVPIHRPVPGCCGV
jgi:hypothetical protein